jgi:hypothetical protein
MSAKDDGCSFFLAKWSVIFLPAFFLSFQKENDFKKQQTGKFGSKTIYVEAF